MAIGVGEVLAGASEAIVTSESGAGALAGIAGVYAGYTTFVSGVNDLQGFSTACDKRCAQTDQMSDYGQITAMNAISGFEPAVDALGKLAKLMKLGGA